MSKKPVSGNFCFVTHYHCIIMLKILPLDDEQIVVIKRCTWSGTIINPLIDWPQRKWACAQWSLTCLFFGWQKWSPTWSSAVVGSLCCAFWDALLLPMIIRSDHLSFFSLSLSILVHLYQNSKRLLYAKLPYDQQILKPAHLA